MRDAITGRCERLVDDKARSQKGEQEAGKFEFESVFVDACVKVFDVKNILLHQTCF